MANGKCWICGGISETGEHRIKKSDLVARFGRGPYCGENALVQVIQGTVRKIQGPDSKLVKYEKNLCADCNSTATQPFDTAYEQFVAWVMANESEVLRRRVVDFESVYGADWEDKAKYLFSFFAKCFGCAVDAIGQSVPPDVINLMRQECIETRFYVTFQVNEDHLLLAPQHQAVGTMGPPIEHTDRESGVLVGFQWGRFYRWLTMGCWYNAFSDQPVGAPWVANSKYLYLGWYETLNPTKRAELLTKPQLLQPAALTELSNEGYWHTPRR